jgi:membrane fusion protein, heavy metal efflux system
VDPKNPSAAVKIFSPASGVIISQNVTDAAAAGVGLSGSSTAFTIADLSHVWVICDVYENDLSTLHLGQEAEIHLNAYPDRVIKGTISDIGAVLDPSLRTAKVRIQVDNPNMLMRIGMFATAVLRGQRPEMHTVVPATAILHLEDRDWVYTPAGNGGFRRIEVRAGSMLAGNQQEVMSGLQPGQKVVAQALSMQNAAAQ